MVPLPVVAVAIVLTAKLTVAKVASTFVLSAVDEFVYRSGWWPAAAHCRNLDFISSTVMVSSTCRMPK
jgi:hypothetical protein